MPEVSVTSLDPRVQKQIENAQTALQRGNFDYVIDVTAQVLKTAPGCLPVRKLQRTAQMKVHQAKSGKMFTKAFGSVTQAGFLFGSGSKDPNKALENAEKLLANDPTNVAGLRLLADAAKGLDLPNTVAWVWECVHELQPNDRDALLSMGEAYYAVKNAKDALRAADLILKMRPQDGEAMTLMRKASILQTEDKGKWDDKGSFRDKLKDAAQAVSLEQAAKVVTSEEMTQRLIKEATERHQQQPESLDHIRAIADGYRRLNNLPEALVWIRKARELPAGKADTALEKLESDLRTAQVEHDIKALEAELVKTPNAPALQAKLETAKGELAQFKLAEAKSFVERYPNDYAARFTLANLYFDAHDYQNALANYQQALKNPKTRVPSLTGMGKSFKARKMFDLAVAQLQNAKTEVPQMDDVKKEIIYELGDCYEKMGKKEEAINEFKLIYAEDIGYRDVADKINAFYSS
jgi:tetratricopeptide (TPR) repeat protein